MMHKDAVIERVADLVTELEHITGLLEDESYAEAYEELTGQTGTIQTLILDMKGWEEL